MKRSLLFTFSALLTALFLTGCNQVAPPKLPWETPMGYEVRIEMDLKTYINEEYRFALNYPNIFAAVEEKEDGTGMIALASSAQLTSWYEPLNGRALKEVYENAVAGTKVKEGSVEGKYFDTALYFNFIPEKDDEQVGYCYMMVNGEDVYGYSFIYPSKDMATFEKYCDVMHKRLLTWPPDGKDSEKVADFVEAQENYEKYIAEHGSEADTSKPTVTKK